MSDHLRRIIAVGVCWDRPVKPGEDSGAPTYDPPLPRAPFRNSAQFGNRRTVLAGMRYKW